MFVLCYLQHRKDLIKDLKKSQYRVNISHFAYAQCAIDHVSNGPYRYPTLV